MKTVLITGAAKGIGKSIALEFKKEGYSVCVTYKSSSKEANRLRAEYGIDIYNLDVTNSSMVNDVVSSIVKKYGKIDVLVNNSGICEYTMFQDITDFSWNAMIETNLTGVFNVTRSVIDKSMIHEKSGSIINIASIWGSVGGAMEVHYSTAKAGVIGFTKALAKEVGLSNITVNSVSPGAIQTDMISTFTDEEKRVIAAETALGRIGTTEDIAGVATFLASRKARYITGQNIAVDGGMSFNG